MMSQACPHSSALTSTPLSPLSWWVILTSTAPPGQTQASAVLLRAWPSKPGWPGRPSPSTSPLALSPIRVVTMNGRAHWTLHGITLLQMCLQTSAPPLYDWPASLRSDHCGVCSYWVSQRPPMAVPEPPLCNFDPSINNAASDLWDQCIDASLPPVGNRGAVHSLPH